MERGNERLRLSLRAGAAAALALSISGVAAQKQRMQRQTSESRKHVINRSEDVCRALAGSGTTLQFTAEKALNGDDTGVSWMVDCADTQGADRAHMIWAANASTLRSVSRATPIASPKLSRPLSRKEAVTLAGQWLQTLPMASQNENWRLSETRKSLTAWHVSCRTDTYRAHIVIDAVTGEFLSAFGGKHRT